MGHRSFGGRALHGFDVLAGHFEDLYAFLGRLKSYGGPIVSVDGPSGLAGGSSGGLEFRLLEVVLHAVVIMTQVFRRNNIQVAPLAELQLVLDLGPRVLMDPPQILLGRPPQRVILAHFCNLFDIRIEV